MSLACSPVFERVNGRRSCANVSGEGATLEQVQRIRELVREEMAERLAREQVLGKGWVEPLTSSQASEICVE